MKCYSCKLTGICKIYQMSNDVKLIAEVTIHECVAFAPLVPKINTAPQSYPSVIRLQRTPEEINEIAVKIKEQKEKISNQSENTKNPAEKNQKIETIIAPIIPRNKICPACNEESKDFIICSKCDKTICPGCAIETINNSVTICEECWGKDEPS